MIKIIKYPFGFKVLAFTPRHQETINDFILTLSADKGPAKKPNKFSKEPPPKPTYYASTKISVSNCNHRETTFHIAWLNDLLYYLDYRGVVKGEILVEEHVVAPAATHNLQFDMEPRDEEQAEALDFAFNAEGICTLHADTGFGKTYLGYKLISMRKIRTAIISEPNHIKTWVEKANTYMGVTEDKIFFIQGKASIASAIELSKAGEFNYDIVAVSAPTFREFIKTYESDIDYPYDCTPHELFELLGVGFVIRDEAHEAFRQVVVQTAYTVTTNILYLTATLVDGDRRTMAMYDKVMPKKSRFDSTKNTHLHIYPCRYWTDPTLIKKKLKYNGPHGYSHIKYETSLIKNRRLLAKYFQIIDDVVTKAFIEVRHEQGKLLIYFSLKEMCRLYHLHAKQKFPQINHGYYVEGQPKTELAADLITTTPKSLGTGSDIEFVESTLLTVAMDSEKTSRQIAGRARKDKRLKTRFLYLVNASIRKHVEYDERRRLYMAQRCASLTEYRCRGILSEDNF